MDIAAYYDEDCDFVEAEGDIHDQSGGKYVGYPVVRGIRAKAEDDWPDACK